MVWRQHTKSVETQKRLPRVLLSFDPQLQTDYETVHLRPWATFTQVFTHTRQTSLTVWPWVQPKLLHFFFFSILAVASYVLGVPLSRWLCPSNVFSTNLFLSLFILDSIKVLSLPCFPQWLSKRSLGGAVDCTPGHGAVIQCYWGCYNSLLCDQGPPQSPAAAPRDKRQEPDVASMSQSWEALMRATFQTFCVSDFFFFLAGCSICVSQCCVGEFLSQRRRESNINITCDPSSRNPKQTAEPCWDALFSTWYHVKPQANHGAVLFVLLRTTAHTKAKPAKTTMLLVLARCETKPRVKRSCFLFISIS